MYYDSIIGRDINRFMNAFDKLKKIGYGQYEQTTDVRVSKGAGSKKRKRETPERELQEEITDTKACTGAF